ncbi:unnamed protein product [Linum tenue]|uniref:Uncharacterized protein n=1 Tax=Linum tenue TaxID=586396 RepID=A0AAV0Q3W0_9ROSI|nr:unnamed protein product [Linum tenue]
MAAASKSPILFLVAVFLVVSFSNVEVGMAARQLLQLPNLPPLPVSVPAAAGVPVSIPVSVAVPSGVTLPISVPGVAGLPKVAGVRV